MKRTPKTKKVLRKLSNDEVLTKQEKETLKNLVAVLKKALKDKSLNAKDRALINETIQKSRLETLTLSELSSLVMQMFQLGLLIKDST